VPNRIIKEKCRTSPTLARLTHGAERLFWRLITFADDFGRFEADPMIVMGQCFSSMLDKVKKSNIEDWMGELNGNELVTRYFVDGKTYAFFNTWDNHNRRRAQNSKYPMPTSDNICQQMTANVSETPRSETPRSEKRDIHPRADVVILPDWLDPKIWETFKTYRKKSQKPLIEETVLKKLAKYKDDGQDPNEIIEQTIANGWTGLFPVQKQLAADETPEEQVARMKREGKL